MDIELNKLYCMDNLELLKQLDDNSIDLIYSDVLYNTRKKFDDYEDNLGTPEEAMEWYKPRVKEMHRVLKETGSIYIHCDYRLSHYLKVLMDEIFGFDNFRSDIVWDTASLNVAGFKTKSNNWIYASNNILYYVKSNNFTFNKQYFPYGQEWIDKNFKYEDDNGKYRITRRKNKIYLHEEKGQPLTNIWKDILSFNYVKAARESVGYNTQKPIALLERIIKSSSNEGDVVADFFLGSGTTVKVANDLNRKYIGCDTNQKSIDLTEKRLKNVV